MQVARASAWLLLVAAVSLAAEIVDRIAVSIDKQIITASQILEEIRVTAFLNRSDPDFSPAEKRRAADRLVEQMLIKRAMEISRYPIPPQDAANELLTNVIEQSGNDATYRQALERYGITADELKDHLWWQVTTLRFIDYRFRPAIQISDADLRDAYQKQVAEWKQRGVQPVPGFEESRDALAKIVTEQRVDEALNTWMAETRKQVNIAYRKDAFQ
jgi:hypothetical protein